MFQFARLIGNWRLKLARRYGSRAFSEAVTFRRRSRVAGNRIQFVLQRNVLKAVHAMFRKRPNSRNARMAFSPLHPWHPRSKRNQSRIVIPRRTRCAMVAGRRALRAIWKGVRTQVADGCGGDVVNGLNGEKTDRRGWRTTTPDNNLIRFPYAAERRRASL